MAINTRKVIVGGLTAGVVLFALDFLVNALLLAEQNEAALTALNPALAENVESAGLMAFFVAFDLALGIILVWTYAAIRPRFGAGPRTAFMAGGLIWLLFTLMYTGQTAMGMWDWGYFFTGTAIYLMVILLAAYVGARLYQEGEGPAAQAEAGV